MLVTLSSEEGHSMVSNPAITAIKADAEFDAYALSMGGGQKRWNEKKGGFICYKCKSQKSWRVLNIIGY